MSPFSGSAPSASTASAERSDRTSARTSQPSLRRRWIRRPPMKPEPPVTNAVSATRRTLPTPCHAEPDRLDRAPGRNDQRVLAGEELARLEAQLVRARLARLGD